MKYVLAGAMVASSLFAAVPASAEVDNCTEIVALPITIVTQGIYCLKQNLNVNLAAGNAITVNAGNVVVEFNGWRVNNQAALATTTARGVYAEDRKNVTLRNGFIRGFAEGIVLEETVADQSESHLVEDMKIADSSTRGIHVEGDMSVIRNNRVLTTGGNSGNMAFAITLGEVDDGVVSGNIINGVSETALSVGIAVLISNRAHVTDNVITSIDGAPDDNGVSVGSSDGVTVARNRILNSPGTGDTGIRDVGGTTNMSCLDNDIGGHSSALSGCDFADNNRTLFN